MLGHGGFAVAGELAKSFVEDGRPDSGGGHSGERIDVERLDRALDSGGPDGRRGRARAEFDGRGSGGDGASCGLYRGAGQNDRRRCAVANKDEIAGDMTGVVQRTIVGGLFGAAADLQADVVLEQIITGEDLLGLGGESTNQRGGKHRVT